MPGSLRSYWSNTTNLAGSSSILSGQHDTEVVVIGAGYTGLSCALHCANAGLNTILLEAGEPGTGGSGRNAGQWLPGWASQSPEAVLRVLGEEAGARANTFMREALALFQNLVKTHEAVIDLNQSGVLQLAKKESQLHKLFALARQWSAYDIQVEQHNKNSLTDYVLSDDYIGGIRFSDAGTLNPLSYTNYLANSACQSGAKLFIHSPVTGLNQEGALWCAATDSGVVRARSVVIATNAYTPDALWPGLNKAYYCLRLPMLVSTSLADEGKSFLPQRTPFAELTTAGLFGGMLTPDSRWLVSTLPLRDYDEDIQSTGEWAMSRFRRTFPDAKEFTWDQLWWGDIALTGNGLPKLVRLADNVYTAFGYSGAGIVLATGLGRELAKIMITQDERESLYPLSPLKSMAMPDFVPWIARKLIIPGLRRAERMGM